MLLVEFYDFKVVRYEHAPPVVLLPFARIKCFSLSQIFVLSMPEQQILYRHALSQFTGIADGVVVQRMRLIMSLVLFEAMRFRQKPIRSCDIGFAVRMARLVPQADQPLTIREPR